MHLVSKIIYLKKNVEKSVISTISFNVVDRVFYIIDRIAVFYCTHKKPRRLKIL